MSTKEKELEVKEQSTSCCSGEKAHKEDVARLEKVEVVKKEEKQVKSGGCGCG